MANAFLAPFEPEQRRQAQAFDPVTFTTLTPLERSQTPLFVTTAICCSNNPNQQPTLCKTPPRQSCRQLEDDKRTFFSDSLWATFWATDHHTLSMTVVFVD
jgi:hypothetical protein